MLSVSFALIATGLFLATACTPASPTGSSTSLADLIASLTGGSGSTPVGDGGVAPGSGVDDDDADDGSDDDGADDGDDGGDDEPTELAAFRLALDSPVRIYVNDIDICNDVEDDLPGPDDPIGQLFYEQMTLETDDPEGVGKYTITIFPNSDLARQFVDVQPVEQTDFSTKRARFIFDDCNDAFTPLINDTLIDPITGLRFWDYNFEVRVRLTATGEQVFSAFVIFRGTSEADFARVLALPFSSVVVISGEVLE
jgi:hypothetical protein